MLKKMKIKNKMLVIILGINMAMLLLIFIGYYVFMRRLLVSETEAKALSRVESVGIAFEGFLMEKAKIGWTLSRNLDFREWLATNTKRNIDINRDPVYRKIVRQLDLYASSDPDLKTAFLASEKTQFYWDNLDREIPDEYMVGTRAWYKNVAEKGRPTFDVDFDWLDKSIGISYRDPIYDDNGKFLGVGGIDISLENLTQMISRLDNVFRTGQTYLLDSEGIFLFHPDHEYVLNVKLEDLTENNQQYRHLDRLARRIESKTAGIEQVTFDGRNRHFICTPIQELDWMMMLSVESSEIYGPLNAIARTSVIVLLFTAGFLVISIIFFTKSITTPLEKLVAMFRDIAQGKGDLTRRLEVNTEDEIGEVARWFNLFVDKLNNVIFQVKSNTEIIAGATGDISSTASQLAIGAEEQNAQTTEVAGSVQEMAATIIQNSQSAQATADIAERAGMIAREGTEAMKSTRKGMDSIVEASEQTGEIVKTMSERTIKIHGVIRVIEDIAIQTNLLALNAAIEASSAGEHGKGFSVVADEIRKLAISTKEATSNIAETILEIQEDVQRVKKAMEDSETAVSQGTEATDKSEEVLNDIVDSVLQVLDMVKLIATGSEEQKNGAQEISKSVAAISAVTNQSTKGAEQMAQAAVRLNEQTSALKELVNQFKLKEVEN